MWDMSTMISMYHVWIEWDKYVINDVDYFLSVGCVGRYPGQGDQPILPLPLELANHIHEVLNEKIIHPYSVQSYINPTKQTPDQRKRGDMWVHLLSPTPSPPPLLKSNMPIEPLLAEFFLRN